MAGKSWHIVKIAAVFVALGYVADCADTAKYEILDSDSANRNVSGYNGSIITWTGDPKTTVQADTSEDCLVNDLTFALNGVINSMLCLVGISSNVFNIVVLTRKQMRSATNMLLLALAVADIGVLFFASLYYLHFNTTRPPTVNSVSPTEPFFWKLYFRSWYIMSNIFLSASNWLILSVAVFRFVAVCFPIKAMKLCSARHAKVLIVFLYIAAVLLNIPDFLTVRLVQTTVNGTSTTEINGTELFSDKTFLTVYANGKLALNVIIPWLACLVLSIKLIVALRSNTRKFVPIVGNSQRPSRDKSNHVTRPSADGRDRMYSTVNRNSSERHISRMLIVLIFWFIFCEIPAFIWYQMVWIYGRDYVLTNTSLNILRLVADSFLVANYASNFFLYALSNQFYRKVMVAILTCKVKRLRSLSINSRYKSSVVQNLNTEARNNLMAMVQRSRTPSPSDKMIDRRHTDSMIVHTCSSPGKRNERISYS